MSSIIKHLFFVVFISAVRADRNIDASPGVCAKFPNEEFAIDLRRCQNTCSEYGRTWDCPGYKPHGDCYCKKGFARIVEDGKCVSVTRNATCAKRLPITAESCAEDEDFSDGLAIGTCEEQTCLTYRCSSAGGMNYKWSPNCQCAKNYIRLKNGTCVDYNDPLCIEEQQPSPERCSQLRKVYNKIPQCQVGCYGNTYCPEDPDPACVCPPKMIPYAYQYPHAYEFTYLQCYAENRCPSTTPSY